MPTTNTPGPQPISAGGAVGYNAPMGNRRDRRDWFVNKFQSVHARVRTVTNISIGDWYVEWPNLSQTPEAPTVANLVDLGINHWASVGGAILPSVRAALVTSDKRAGQKARARKRERRIRELWDKSNASELAALLWGDYAGAGFAVCGAWTNFEEPDPAKRDPYLVRFDPRHTYILKDNVGNITELLVARVISKQELRLMYPEYARFFEKSRDEDIEEWFWYTGDEFLHAVVDVSSEGASQSRQAILLREENPLGFVPAWEATRPTFDGQRRGVFDQTVHILRTMHRLMTLTIYSAEEHSFPTIVEFDAVNPGDFGPGSIISLRSPEGRLDRLAPQQHFDVKDLIGRLAEQAQNQSVFPQQLLGEPGASIVSARGINASMGAIDARLALAHKQFEVLFGKVSGFLLAIDETFCDGEKEITGDVRDGNKAEKFTPSEDIAGQWGAVATYGIGAGSDPANIEMRLNMNLSSGLLSRETARRQLPFLDDPDLEPVLQMREAMRDSLIAGILAQSQQGMLEPVARALKALQADDVDIDGVVEELVEFLLAPPEPAGGPPGLGGPAGAVQGAESLARGGIPGNAEQAPDALGLPPLGALIGQDSRQVS